MAKPVGFDQKIIMDYLDFVAREAAETSRQEMYGKLAQYLALKIKGEKSRKNVSTILMKIWFPVDDGHLGIQREALKLIPELTPEQRLAIHWGMTLIAYPFFYDLVKELGNLFTLQDEVASAQIGRKMKHLYGDRRRVEVSTGAVLMSLNTWGVLERRKDNSYRYQTRAVEDTRLKMWLLHVVLQTSGSSSLVLDALRTSPVTFPFRYSVNTQEFHGTPLVVHRQGLNMTVVSLR